MHHLEFEKRFCSRLNSQQKEAVYTTDGPVLLLAVPGSGKTTVLVNRLGYMVHCCNIAPDKILTMTYTKSATGEMRQRFAESFGKQYAQEMEFCTINSLAVKVLNYYSWHQSRKPVPKLIENDISIKLIAQIYGAINNDYATENIIKDIQTAITYIKNMIIPAHEIRDLDVGIDNFEKIYEAYNNYLKENSMMDFDDQLIYAHTVLKKFPKILEHFQETYPYICVDEAQDTSKLQHEIIKLLASKYKNIFMVGDEDQSIYGFRAAYPEALLSFEEDYSKARILLMEENYRSVKEIVARADSFISHNKDRYPKRLKAARASGAQVNIIELEKRSFQYNWLYELAKNCKAETAVLYRNNDSALPLIDLLERNNISYDCRKFEDSFFSHRVVVDMQDIINFAYEPCNHELFMRIYYKFGNPISRKMAESACEESRRTGRTILNELSLSYEIKGQLKEFILLMRDIFSVLPELEAEEAVYQIWKILKYSSYVAKNGLDAGKYDILSLIARHEKRPKDFLQRLKILRELILNHKNSTENKLVLSTIHSSKGLEYDKVYILDAFDGILPSKRLTECRQEDDFKQYEEDRRIFYVGMTRAENELYVFRNKDKSAEFADELSSYIPREIVDEDELFASLKKSLIGKTYRHREYGKGVIKGQCRDRLLVLYCDNKAQLSSMAELASERDTVANYEETKPMSEMTEAKAVKQQEVVTGMTVKHKTFGIGEVLSVKDDIAKISFSQIYGEKRIMLSTSLKNGILTIP